MSQLVERAAGRDRKIDRLEVFRAHDLVVGGGTLTLGRRRANDLERPSALIGRTERQARRPRHASHPRQGHDFALDIVEELQQRLARRILRPERIHQHRQHAIGAIAAIDALDGQQRPQQQSCADEQQHGGRDLGDDEQRADHAISAGDGSRVGSRERRRRDLAGLPCRDDAKQHADHNGSDGTERDHAPVEGERHRSRQQPFRNHRRGDAQDRRADANSQCAADQGEQQALGDELTDHPPPARAQRRADRELARPRRRPRQQQIGDVGAADRQHEADHAEKQDRGNAEVAANQGAMHRLDRDASSLVGVRKLLRQSLSDARHLGARGLDRHAGFHAADTAEEVGASHRRAAIEGNHPPHARAAEQLKVLWHDADDRERQAVEPDALADNGGVGVEARPPQRFADDDDVQSRVVVRPQKRAAGDGFDPEDVEESGRDPLASDGFGRPVFAVHDHAADVGDEPGDQLEAAAAIVPVGHVDRRHAVARRAIRALPDHDQAIGIGEWQRTKQRRIDQREDGAVGANAERQRQDGHEREARRSPELPQGKLQVVPHRFEALADAHVGLAFSLVFRALDERRTPKVASRCYKRSLMLQT